MRRILGMSVLLGVLATLAVSAVAVDDHHQGEHRDLASLRAATAQFHRISSVEQAGYQLGYIPPFLLNTCIAHPTAGAMGFHSFNHDKIHDTVIDPLSPEAMVYAPRPNGTLKLAAVEWVVPKGLWEAEHGWGRRRPPSSDTRCTS